MQPALQASVNTLNFLGNEPENLVHLGGDFPLEWVSFSKTLDRPGNIALGDREHGAIIFCHMHDGVYEGHYLMNPKRTGKEKLAQCRKIFNTLFTLYEASAIVGHVPVKHFGARVMTRALGFASEGVSADHNGCSCVNYIMERKQWAAYSADWSQRADNT
jgi:hypothetical protein